MQPIKIIVCGDFRAAHPEKISFSDEVTSLFADADLRICNFEAPIHVDGAKPAKKSGPSLNQSANSPAFLKEHGFNVILLANNHIMDYGKEGCEATIRALGNVVTIGAGQAKDAFSIRIVEVYGKKIGFCSLVQKEFGTVDGKDASGYGAAWINSLDIPDIIKEARKQCDYLLVLPHAGVEHTAAPLPEWRSLYRHFIDCGADIVIASHPHCPQGWEAYQGKQIYYSLGDFYFDELSHGELWYKSIVVELNIGDRVEIKEHFLCFDDKTGIISVDRSDCMHNHVDYANRLLQDQKEYYNYIDSMCSKRWPSIKYGLLRGLCGVSLKLRFKHIIRLLGCMFLNNTEELYLLNTIRCESYRWMMQRAIENKYK